MPTIRPVSSEDRFTLVEHLTELRTRIITGLAIFVVAFAFAYWQNGHILKLVNSPLENSQKVSAKKCTSRSGDSTTQSVCFERAVSQVLKLSEPILTKAATGDTRAETLQKAQVLAALRKAEGLSPTSTTRKPVTLGVAEPFFQTINVAMYGALVLSLPLLLYQLYAFLIPAFTPRERKAIVPLLLGVPFLFYAGVAFGYFIALPRAVDFLQNFNSNNFDILVQAKDYYKFVAIFLAGTGLVFQVPVLVIAITRLGILTPKQLRKQRGMVLIISAVVAAVITPTPDAVTMILMMAPLVVLFEISVFIAGLIERRSPATGVRGRFQDWRDLGAPSDDDDPDDGSGGGFGGDHDGPGGGGFGGDDPDGGGSGPLPNGNTFAAPYAGDDDVEFHDDVEAPGPALRDDPEAPDPALLGDPAGPRLATQDDGPPVAASPAPAGDQSAEGWLREADALDAGDPFAVPDEDYDYVPPLPGAAPRARRAVDPGPDDAPEPPDASDPSRPADPPS